MQRVKLLCASVLAVLALGAVAASSAAAFSWWIETGPKEERVLNSGEKELFEEAAKVTTPFTLAWKKEFAIACTGAKYHAGFIEGLVGLGAGAIVFEGCKATKPAGCKLTKERLETTSLTGEIRWSKAVKSEVEFVLKAKAGTTILPFTLEGTGCSKREVKIVGSLAGEITKPVELTKEKAFGFVSNGTLEAVEQEIHEKVESNEGEVGYSATKGWSAH